MVPEDPLSKVYPLVSCDSENLKFAPAYNHLRKKAFIYLVGHHMEQIFSPHL